ncbi:plexin-B3 isoform 2-T3 [Discoglossus pictus]
MIVMLRLCPSLLLFHCLTLCVSSYPTFLQPNVTFNHMARDPSSGSIFIGAVNWIYQLSPDLNLVVENKTGPKMDSPDCLPQECNQANPTDNTNKLLIVNPYSGELLTCGQVFQGICEKRNLTNISDIIYKTEDPGDNQFVAANDPKVTTVGIVERAFGSTDRLFVGRGLTARFSGGIPPITIRQLDKAPIFSNEGLGKLVVGDFSDYNNNYVGVFSNKGHIYFLFFRRGSKFHTDYKTYLGSICIDDPHLYSYVEVPLRCGEEYNLAQAVYLETVNRELFVVFSASQGPTSTPSPRTALCSYKMVDIEERINKTRRLCYTNAGAGEDNKEEAYIEYGVSSKCAKLPEKSPENYPCGGDHTPSPIASRVPIQAQPLLTDIPGLTAVAALVENTHTMVFLGNTGGDIHKVFVSGDSSKVYSVVTAAPGSPVNPDLLLDSSGRQLYVMTESQVTKLPVTQCSIVSSCDSCLQAGDPFCGWCVLQGRCTEKQQCVGYNEDRWLWSYEEGTACLTIQDLTPANQSRQEQTQISFIVRQLPALAEEHSWHCLFNEWSSEAHVYGERITCSSPPPEELPPNQQGKDHVTLRLALVFQNVTIAVSDYSVYDCGAVMELAVSAPCAGCVSSPWTCYWCVSDHRCTHSSQCSQEQTVIYSDSDGQAQLRGPDSCPSLEGIVGSELIPVGVERELDLVGRNLHLLQGEEMGYSCIIESEGSPITLRAQIEAVTGEEGVYQVHCQAHKYEYPLAMLEHRVTVHVRMGDAHRVDNRGDIQVALYNCSVGQSDCSLCRAADPRYQCVWCGSEETAMCLYTNQCEQRVTDVCPTPIINSFTPVSGIIHGGTLLTIHGTNMGQSSEELSVKVAGHPCELHPDLYVVSKRIVCTLSASNAIESGPVEVSVGDRHPGVSSQNFAYQDPVLQSMFPLRGPMAGGTQLNISGSSLLTGDQITVFLGGLPCAVSSSITENQIQCITSPSSFQQELPLRVFYGEIERILQNIEYNYTENPTILSAAPTSGFYGGGRVIRVEGSNLDVVQAPLMTVLAKTQKGEERGLRKKRRRKREEASGIEEFSERCHHNSSTLMECLTPSVPEGSDLLDVQFVLDNVRISFSSLGENFTYQKNPAFSPLNKESNGKPFRLKPGNVLDIEGVGLDSGISKREVIAMIGDGVCTVKTLTHNHLYCEPPLVAPQPLDKSSPLPEFVVQMGNLRINLGTVEYDVEGQTTFPMGAKIGLGVGGALLVPVVLIIIFMYRRQSKLAKRDYKKVLVQLENLETSVGDQCRKEFTDLMTEMMDLTSDLEGSGIPFLDYKTYIERIFFPGQTGSPLRKSLDVPEGRRATVEQGLTQLSNLLNNKLFLTKLIETLDAQPTLSQRDRCQAASLLTVALHSKLEYLTDVMRTLLSDLIDQCVAKNPKLLLRRTETIVEKMLTNWMSICLHPYLREAAAEPLYMLYCAIKYQVDKGPVDAVTGKAKRTLNDGRLLREDIEYRPITLTAMVKNAGEAQRVPVRVLDTDTITQVKEKILNHVFKGTPFSQRPPVHTLDLEWRSGKAGHLTLSDEDLTSLTQDQWKRLNTLHHYKVQDGATVALIPRLHNNLCETPNNSFLGGEIKSPPITETPMLEDGEDGGIKTWHLVKSLEEPEVCKRRSSLRERERAKAIPEIYLTRLLSMKGTLQKFVDDTFQVMLGVNRPLPIAIKYIFDFLDEMAEKHEIEDIETVHIWKTHSLMLRFWVLVLKNPQMVFDIEVSENVDSILSVIAQTFIDSCTISEHKVGRDSPVNKLLYAREIPRYKQLVEKYYVDIRQTAPASYQEMNSSLTELSGTHANDLNSLVALQELYNYINKYYDQISTALEEDPSGQKMQLAYRLQQISALVENKVTDL